MTITPKIKIIGGIALFGGGAFGLYKALNKENKNRLAHGVLGGILLTGGILMTIKGFKQNKSLNAMPIQEVDASKQRVKAIIADAVKEGKVSSASGVQQMPAPVQSQSQVKKPVSGNQPVKSQSNPAQSQWQNGRVVGKVDVKNIEASRARKENILRRIDQLKVQHDQIKKTKGYAAGLPVRNEIEILKAQLFWN